MKIFLKIFSSLMIGYCVGCALVFLLIGSYGTAALMAVLAAINYFARKTIN